MKATHAIVCTTIAASATLLNRPQVQGTQLVLPGTVVAYAGAPSNIPSGWLLCDGSAFNGNAARYRPLYLVLGVFHGDGTTGNGHNAESNFNVPDYRGRFLRGVSQSSGFDPDAGIRAPMAAGGNSGNKVGSVQDDVFKEHRHKNFSSEHNGAIVASPRQFLAGGNINHTEGYFGVSPEGGNETRPKNANVYYIIKL